MGDNAHIRDKLLRRRAKGDTGKDAAVSGTSEIDSAMEA
jgi:hypothetical protein